MEYHIGLKNLGSGSSSVACTVNWLSTDSNTYPILLLFLEKRDRELWTTTALRSSEGGYSHKL